MAKREAIPVEINERSEFLGKNVGPLVLVNQILEQMDIRRIVEHHCEPDSRREIPVGEVIHALVANRLCAPEPLLHVAEWAEHSGAEFLLGVPADALNDDRLARALDAVFAKRWDILAEVALHVCATFGVRLAQVHFDPTSFHFTGEYDEQSDDPSFVAAIKPFKIEVGRHARPGEDIKEAQVGVNLANDGNGPVPVFYTSADGSANGHIAVAKNLQHLLKYVKPKRLLMITDRGCFSAKYAIGMVREHHFDFISSVTWSADIAALYDKHKPAMTESSFLSIKEKLKRQRNEPEETWERYSIGEVPYALTYEEEAKPETTDVEAKAQIPSDPSQNQAPSAATDQPGQKKTQAKKQVIEHKMRARLIFVHSTADQKVQVKTRKKYTEKIDNGLAKIQRSVENGYLKELKAVHKKVTDLYGKKQAQHYFSYQVRELIQKEIRSLPPRNRGQRIPTLTFSYTYHPQRARKDAKYDGLYAIATSLPKKTHSTEKVFTAFKQQHHIETAHHKWKAPLRLRPLFLKIPRRIESLIFVQFLALMAFYLLQRVYRLAKGPACRTTAETLVKRFAFCAICVRYEQDSVSVTPFVLKPAQQEILTTLKFPAVEEQITSYVTRPPEGDDES